MRRRVFVGASAAAMLPPALAAAVLVSAPFAGTTTTPLDYRTPPKHAPTNHAVAQHAVAHHAVAQDGSRHPHFGIAPTTLRAHHRRVVVVAIPKWGKSGGSGR